ncbi:glycosyltransferase family 2 protein [Natrarchaeobius oligotrophus]|uniref:Glycosyltransferase family 2 protein n=1 Tax=Natrarchaeobius chitinivorans TaxID=1679083 RepID=A0A3N6M774_NATCH|nr:glycosyltransferase family 2 protein [Natrarchaeobius chitinivorans]RQG99483.1 glycosyltransferase family 2 protein [Natrarchaeobius chitinivorans]
MYREHIVGVVIPAYNEEGFVGDVIREMPSFVDRLYVVDDRSTDGTWDEIHAAAKADRERDERSRSTVPAGGRERTDQTADRNDRSERSDPDRALTDGGPSALPGRATVRDSIGRVVPIRHRENRGAGGAIKTGYLAALEEGVDATVTVDADGQMDLDLMPRLLDPIVDGVADYAKGNRLLSSEYRASMPRFRLVGNAILTFLTKIASGYWKTMDPQNGYTAISREALEAVDVDELYEYYGYCNDLLVKLNASGLAVADVAMPAVYGDEESSITYSQYVPKVSTMLLRNFLWRLRSKYLVRDFHPLALFYLFGTATIAVAGLRWLSTVVFGSGLSGTASPVLLVAGVALLLFAMTFDMAENEHLETQIS